MFGWSFTAPSGQLLAVEASKARVVERGEYFDRDEPVELVLPGRVDDGESASADLFVFAKPIDTEIDLISHGLTLPFR